MALSKLTVELGAVGALLAVMLGGFYHQGARMDQRFDQMDAHFTKRLDQMDAHFSSRLDKVEARLDRMDARVDAISDRLARVEGLLEAVLRGMSPPAAPGQSPPPSRP